MRKYINSQATSCSQTEKEDYWEMCCISGEPVEDPSGRLRTFHGPQKFQVDMMNAPCVDCPYSCFWCLGQFFPISCGCTQYALRSKALQGDLTKYTCFQGYYDGVCCIRSGSCGEKSCPQLCLFVESCICNFAAISATRMFVMEKYNLTSDPCDYRLIRINNCLQIFACFCSILAIIDSNFRTLAQLIDRIADLFYHTVSGCMTAQVSHELDYQFTNAYKGPLVENEVAHAVAVPYTDGFQGYSSQSNPAQSYPAQSYPAQSYPAQGYSDTKY